MKPRSTVLFGFAVSLAAFSSMAQQPKGQPNPGTKPGETTTPPAMAERNPERLKVGDAAPDFSLADKSGKQQVKLSDFKGKRPVVLVFGSMTCPPFRGAVPRIERLHQDYKDRVEFLLLYVREAHPDSTVLVRTEGAKEELRKLPQTETTEARAEHARMCALTLGLSFTALVDGKDNAVNRAYAGWPSRLVVVDKSGKVAYDGGPGPRGFRPDGVADWLKANVDPAK